MSGGGKRWGICLPSGTKSKGLVGLGPNLRGSKVKSHVEQVGLLSGAMSSQDVIWVLHGVHEKHHL